MLASDVQRAIALLMFMLFMRIPPVADSSQRFEL